MPWGILGMLGGGGLGLPMIIGGVLAAITALAGLGLYAQSAWTNHEIGLRNEGARSCITAVNTASLAKSEMQNQELQRLLESEQARSAALNTQVDAIRSESGDMHSRISTLMKEQESKPGGACMVPNTVIRVLNESLSNRGVK